MSSLKMARIKLSTRDCEVILMLALFWLENIEQEDTDKETYLEVCDLREVIERGASK